MDPRVKHGTGDGKGQKEQAWPASLARDCRFHGDLFLDHDTERIAALSGRSRRDTNRLRERGGLEDERLTEVETIARYLYAGRALGFDFWRRAALVQPILEALDADAAPRLPIVDDVDVMRALTAAVRECGEAAAKTLEAMPGGISVPEREAIKVEIEQAVGALQQLAVVVVNVPGDAIRS